MKPVRKCSKLQCYCCPLGLDSTVSLQLIISSLQLLTVGCPNMATSSSNKTQDKGKQRPFSSMTQWHSHIITYRHLAQSPLHQFLAKYFFAIAFQHTVNCCILPVIPLQQFTAAPIANSDQKTSFYSAGL